MYKHLIAEMVEALVDFGAVKSEDTSLATAAIGSVWVDRAANVWDIHDVWRVAEEAGVSLTVEEARAILHDTVENQDASVGVNWDVIEDNITWRKASKEADNG